MCHGTYQDKVKYVKYHRYEDLYFRAAPPGGLFGLCRMLMPVKFTPESDQGQGEGVGLQPFASRRSGFGMT